MTIRLMRNACWIPKTTNTHTHSEHVIPITFPQQQWLRERGSVLRCTHIASLVQSYVLKALDYTHHSRPK